MRIFAAALMLFCLVYSSHALSAEKGGFKIQNSPEVSQIKPKKPVRVKLQRHGDGKYTWDVTGEDVDEIIKADRKLKKTFGSEEKQGDK